MRRLELSLCNKTSAFWTQLRYAFKNMHTVALARTSRFCIWSLFVGSCDKTILFLWGVPKTTALLRKAGPEPYTELASRPFPMPAIARSHLRTATLAGPHGGTAAGNERKAYRPKSAVCEGMELPTRFQDLWELTLTLNLRLQNCNQTFKTLSQRTRNTVIGLNHSGSSP